MQNSGDKSGEEALIAYLSKEKVASQSRLKSMMLFCSSVQSGSPIVNESLEILRQNAESDYDTILHLLTLLRHNKNAKETDTPISESSTSSSSISDPSTGKSSQKLTSSSTQQNEFVMTDPLTEGFEEDFSRLSSRKEHDNVDRISEESDNEEESHHEEENKENNSSSNHPYANRRFIKEKTDDTMFARSLPVNVPLSRKDFMKRRYEPDEEDIPEDLEKGIAFIMSLKEKSFDLSDPRFSFKVE